MIVRLQTSYPARSEAAGDHRTLLASDQVTTEHYLLLAKHRFMGKVKCITAGWPGGLGGRRLTITQLTQARCSTVAQGGDGDVRGYGLWFPR